MNDRDLFHLILDEPEPDFPSVVDAAVADGKRVRRRRRVTALGSVAAVLAIGGLGLAFAPSNHEAVRPATPPPVSVSPHPTPTPSRPAPADPTPPDTTPEVAKTGVPNSGGGKVDNGLAPNGPQSAQNPKRVPGPRLHCGETKSRDKCGANPAS